MASENTYKDDPSYWKEGKLVLDTVQQRIAAEISLKEGFLAEKKIGLQKNCNYFKDWLSINPKSWKTESALVEAKENLSLFISNTEPLRKSRSLKELQADLKELEDIEKTMSITNPDHPNIMTYIEKRTAEISVLKNELTQHYATRLQKLEGLSAAQTELHSPWKGQWEGQKSHNYVADLLSIFVNEKRSATLESSLLLKRTIEIVEKYPAQKYPHLAKQLVERVKKELAQQKSVVETPAPSIENDKDEDTNEPKKPKLG